MKYKKYGNTGMKVSAIGMGCMRYDEAAIQAGRLEECAEVALHAYARGINYFDTAPFYCLDQSETITGLALAQMKRDEVVVSSKANLDTMGSGRNAAAFRRRLEKTLTRLKTDYLDVYHLWCLKNIDEFDRVVDALYPFFVDARAEGLIRHIAFSSHMPGDELETAIGHHLFEGMLIGYNVMNFRIRQRGIAAAAAQDMGVVVMNPLNGGLIPRHPELFTDLVRNTGLSPAQAALRFVASHREISVTLNGFSTKAHVDEACGAVEGLVEKSLPEVMAELNGVTLSLDNLCTGCGYCKGCPADIDIPKYMDSYNMKILGLSIEDQLNDLWGISADKAADCTRCGQCESKCTQHLPIMDRLAEIADLNRQA